MGLDIELVIREGILCQTIIHILVHQRKDWVTVHPLEVIRHSFQTLRVDGLVE